MRKGLLVVLLAMLLAPAAWPQASTGAVSGTVRDKTGAVIPNVQITLTDTATNVARTTRTNEVGFSSRFPGWRNTKRRSPCRCSRA